MENRNLERRRHLSEREFNRNLWINSIFELLPDHHDQFSILDDDSSGLLWTEGKKILVSKYGKSFVISGPDIETAMSSRIMPDVHSIDSITEEDAMYIIDRAITMKYKSLWP